MSLRWFQIRLLGWSCKLVVSADALVPRSRAWFQRETRVDAYAVTRVCFRHSPLRRGIRYGAETRYSGSGLAWARAIAASRRGCITLRNSGGMSDVRIIVG
jgi:hypothetical protein